MAAGLSADNLNKILDLLTKAEQGSIVQAISELHKYLLEEKLAFKMKLQCDMIGVHFQNRDGIGCSATHVSDLITNIAAIGFVESEVKAICIEVPPDARGDRVREFNRHLIADAAGKLAPVDEKSLRYASIVGSHTNQAFRAMKAGLVHEDTKVTVDGKLSMAKLASFDSDWHRCILEGVEWLVISHSVAEHFPNYAALAQAAGNTAGQIASVEHELQLARKVNVAMDSWLRKNPGCKTVGYADIAGEILRSRPPCGSALPGMFVFVLKFGGGVLADSFLCTSERFIRSHGCPNRSLGNEAWTALAAETKGKQQHVPWRHMLLKLAYSGPEKVLFLGDLKRAFSRDILTKATQAENFAADFLVLLKSSTLSPEAIGTAIGQVEIDMAAVVLGKKKTCKHESMEAVLHERALSLGLTSKWAPAAASTPASSSKEVAGQSAA